MLSHNDVAALLTACAGCCAPALSARSVEWREQPRHVELAASRSCSPVRTAAVGALPAGLTRPTAAVVLIRRASHRATCSSFPSAAAGCSPTTSPASRRWRSDRRPPHRCDPRITHERYERELREQEIGKLATEAELRALRAQINPHFLFNALTTIGYLIQTAPPRALDTLMRLTSLLRAVLRSEGELTTLGRELEIVEAYLDIERARFETAAAGHDRRAGAAARLAGAAAHPAAAGRKRGQARHRADAAAAATSSSRRASIRTTPASSCWSYAIPAAARPATRWRAAARRASA